MLRCHIVKEIGSFRLNIDLTAQSQVTALFGPSGSGKSLTLQCIAGLLAPDSGQIAIGERTLYDAAAGVNLPSRERRVGYLFQNYALFPHLTAAENIAYGLHRLPKSERAERLQEALRTVRLEGMAERYPAQLSGGQQQRVALARALVGRPAILLLDEPFAALDSIVRAQLQQELLQILRAVPIPAVLVTHQLDEAYALSREMAVLEAGRVLQAGPRDEVYYRPRTRAVAELVGASNFLPGTVVDAADKATRIAGPGGLELWGPPVAGFQPGRQVTCCIRPEHVMVVRKDRAADESPGAFETWLPGRMIEEVHYGSHVSLCFRPDPPGAGRPPVPDLMITVATYMYHRLEIGADPRQTVALKARYLHLIPS
jgi:molybdate transport system ATP-binding protein